MKQYYITTYGCQINQSDSERIISVLENIGYKPVSKTNEADLILINSCSVRQSAVDRVYGQIKNYSKLKKKNPKLKILLTGCILKYDYKKLKDKKLFDYMLSIDTLPDWGKILQQKKDFQYSEPRNKKEISYSKIKPKYNTKYSAYIPIIIGCNNFCSYCVVPYTRGPEISMPAEEIIKEIKNLIKKGYKEIWLLGENVNSYKSQIPCLQARQANPKSQANHKHQISKLKSVNFSELLKMVNDIPGNFWIRFTSSHPKDFSDELIKTIKECDKITKYISLPVQSGDSEVLKKMNRPYIIEDYKKIIKKIRKEIPNITLSTDIIVGFCGETKKQFENTIKLFKKINPDMAYIARYSPRHGTAAYKMKDTVSKQEKENRDKKLTEILKKTALKNNRQYIGKIIEALPEYERKEWLIGKTKEYKTIKFKGNKNLIGKFVKLKITDAIPWGLRGKLLKSDN